MLDDNVERRFENFVFAVLLSGRSDFPRSVKFPFYIFKCDIKKSFLL